MDGRLYLDFCGEEHTLEPGDQLSFGRCGDLVIDDNPYLHRVVGVFSDRGGTWWLHHVGSRTAMTLRDLNAPSVASLAQGGGAGIHFGEFAVAFGAGPTNYELLGALERHEWDVDLLGPDGLDGMRTLEWAQVDLNDDQRLLLLALCEHELLDPMSVDRQVPTNRAVAARLGWTLPKVNRKLDHLAEKLARAGVDGVHGAAGDNAANRRRNVVDHSVRSGLVHAGELVLLDRAAPRATA